MDYSWDDFVQDVEQVANDFSDSVTGDDDRERARKDAKKKEEERKIEEKNLKDFKNQDFLNPEDELYVPKFNSKKGKEVQEEMLALFNARKDQILQRSAAPGIAQTRF